MTEDPTRGATSPALLGVARVAGGANPGPDGAGETARFNLGRGDWGALARAVQAGHEWLWITARGGRPAAGVLASLLEVAAQLADAEPPPVVIAGALRGRADRLDPDLPSPLLDADCLVAAAPHGRMPIRDSSLVNDLVHRGAVLEHGVPDGDRYGPYAAREWTSRVLRGGGGWLVPACLLDEADLLRRDRRATLRDLSCAARMLRSGAWSRGDAVRGLVELLVVPQGSR